MAALARDDGNVEAYAALAYVQGMFDWDWSRAQATIQRGGGARAQQRRCAVRPQPALDGARAASMPRWRRSTPRHDWTRCRRRSTRPTVGSCIAHAGSTRPACASSERSSSSPGTRRPTRGSRRCSSNWGATTTRWRWWTRWRRSRGAATPSSPVRARILARAGRTAEARRLLAQVPPQSPQRAEVLAALGDRDAAFESLFRALDERESWLLFIKSDPIFDGLHGDPRWAAVLRRMNLQ